MTSTTERQQRAAARARLAREMAERQTAAKKRRQRTIGISAAVGLLLVVGGVVWIVAALTGDDAEPAAVATPAPTAPAAPAAPGECAWVPEDPSSNPSFDMLTEVGTPASGEPREGISTITMETNRGVIEVEMDLAQVPCTAASFSHLASEEFYDGSACHRMTTEGAGIYVLQCGDPTGTSEGGPTYKFAEENLPVGASPTYPRGTIAMAKAQPPATTGSQFFIVYQDTDLPADYTLVGTVTAGMDIVDEVAAGGASDDNGEPTPDGAPNEEIVIETFRVSDPA